MPIWESDITSLEDIRPRMERFVYAPLLSERQRIFPQSSPNGKHLWSPSDLFKVTLLPHDPDRVRWIGALNNDTIALVFADGKCARNGRPDAYATMYIEFAPYTHRNSSGYYRKNLDDYTDEDPIYGGWDINTSSHAKLAAVNITLAGADALDGKQVGVDHFVIATNSSYIVDGLRYLDSWAEAGWCKPNGSPVRNQDLWFDFIEKLERAEATGLLVSFWDVALHRDRDGFIIFE